jgi:hypothetical protein
MTEKEENESFIKVGEIRGQKQNGAQEKILSGNFIVFAEDISNVKLKALFLEVEHEGISGLKA